MNAFEIIERRKPLRKTGRVLTARINLRSGLADPDYDFDVSKLIFQFAQAPNYEGLNVIGQGKMHYAAGKISLSNRHICLKAFCNQFATAKYLQNKLTVSLLSVGGESFNRNYFYSLYGP
jgi:hypothetical protein